MDSITHIVTGAVIADIYFEKPKKKLVFVLGIITASLPDFDVILYLFYDFREMLSIHRGLSHSIFFNLIIGFLISILFSKYKLLGEYKFIKILTFTYLCLASHLLLDVFTAYGTQVLLPFSNFRIGLDIINVVDPVFTLPLLICFLMNQKFISNQNYSLIGLSYCILYLIGTFGVKYHVDKININEMKEYFTPEFKSMSIPVSFGSRYWYAVNTDNTNLYLLKIDAFKGILLQKDEFKVNTNLLINSDQTLVDEMKWFAKNFYTVDTFGSKIRFYNLQVDMRGPVLDQNRLMPTKGYFVINSNTVSPASSQ